MATKIPVKNTTLKAQPVCVLDVQTIMAMVNAYADTLMENAYANFRSKPSGGNTWNDLQAAMMVYQQTKWANVSETTQAQLASAITDAPIGAWGGIIVQVTTGMALNEALERT
jgi:hypothetical protein